ncbi:hypothetical protein [Plantactinospora soyae]|uniref:Uncharacterized protein n=1 Tax=Plantactinospora soyae TaxID=1544732 RepID=A0A927QZA4_9ACTN|nr:hypothetical protein [Plantactinospora soyae]MBE1487393.1 hypothetical protein [Plantactinospora soyae]
MPDSSTPRAKKAQPEPEVERPTDAATGSAGAEADATDAGAPEPADADATSPDDEEPGFENRAARRAKGKGPAAQQRAHGSTKQSDGGRGSVQGPRQWGNRRTG